MNNIEVLDCTLRDGGRILNCNFGVEAIKQIAFGLDSSGIDIIEMGFLRSGINYQEGTTFFTEISQVEKMIPEKATSEYVVFTDFGMFDYYSLPECRFTQIKGIRFGFKNGEFQEALPFMYHIKDLGYDLYVQSVNSLGYTDEELIEMINYMNQLKPKSFSIVDTYGAMYSEDLQRIYHIIDKFLLPSISLDFHSHNNYQLSFSLAQEIIRLNEASSRTLIIDATLLGMGKGAGNLSTELLVEYLNRKKGKKYDFTTILDTIDEQIYKLSKKYEWGYSIPSLMSGVYKAHPNNVIYLTEKYKLNTKDIVNILSKLDEKTRLSYDYDAIEKIYLEYFSQNQDTQAFDMEELGNYFESRDILVIAPGKSVSKYKEQIEQYITNRHPAIITVNFELDIFNDTYAFWSSSKRYKHFQAKNATTAVIVTSNVKKKTGKEFMVPYTKVIDPICKHFENACLMVLRMLQTFDIQSLAIAGLDGFDGKLEDNYISTACFENMRMALQYEEINADIEMMLRQYVDNVDSKYPISFITPSRFEYVVNKSPRNIQYLVLDVDGTLTDGAIEIGMEGEVFKRFDVKDGYGLVKVKENDIEPIIMTGRGSKIVEKRAAELGIKRVFQNVQDKYAALNAFLEQEGKKWENIAYMGDDLNDLSCIKHAGISACPSDAVQEVYEAVTYQCKHAGGNGAVREFCDKLLQESSF